MRSIFKSSETFRFTILAVVMMLFLKIVIIDGTKQYFSDNKNINVSERAKFKKLKNSVQLIKPIEQNDEDNIDHKESTSFDFSLLLSQPDPIENIFEDAPKESLQQQQELQKEKQPPQQKSPKKYTELKRPVWDGQSKGKIVLIIDDMGMAKKYTQDVIDLPAPMTLAFLPYATGLEASTKQAKSKGHELIIHVPMEPMNPDLDLGPAGLTTDLNREKFLQRLEENVFPSFNGYVGINNHMGSRLTQNKRAMNWLMPELKKRNLFFVDSKTIGSSIAGETAHKYGVNYAERDVFLDHHEDLNSVLKALYRMEKLAHQKGYAIAIGHPKKNTIEGIKRWMVGMEDRGLELVPVSEVLTRFKNDAPRQDKSTQIEIDQNNKNMLAEKLLKYELKNTQNEPLDFIYGKNKSDASMIYQKDSIERHPLPPG